MAQPSSHCTFCDLIRGAAEVSICHEDADSIAFMDIQPVNAGHVLVVPREHYESLLDVPPEIGVHLFRVTMKLAGAVRKVTSCEDMNIVVNSGAAAGQDEPHYHVHIIPRRHGDGFDIPLPFGGSQMPDRTLLDAVAARIIAALRDPMRLSTKREDGDGERMVRVPVFSETPRRAPARQNTPAWRASGNPRSRAENERGDGAREGAHGELLRADEPGPTSM
jgi:histidine triad (HIT) family protein